MREWNRTRHFVHRSTGRPDRPEYREPSLRKMVGREAHRAAVEAGYASLAGYLEIWGRADRPSS